MSVRIARRGAIAASRAVGGGGVAATGLILPGTSGNYASTPDSAANSSLSGEIDVRVHLAMDDWDAASNADFMTKTDLASGRTFRFYRPSSAPTRLRLSLSPSPGSGEAFATVDADHGFTDGTDHWIRATWETVGNVAKFFTSADGSTWTQLGSDRSASVTTLSDEATPVEIGSSAGGTAGLWAGTVYYAELRSSIDGTVVSRFDPSVVMVLGTRDPSSFVSDTGETWTIHGSAWDWATVAP